MALRQVFVSFCAAIVLIGVVVLILGPAKSADVPIGVVPTLVVVSILSIAALVAIRRIPRPLDCTNATLLAESYRKRFFLHLAFSEMPALIGFVAAFVGSSRLPYFVGAAFTAVGFQRLAPTKAHLAQDQERLTNAGCALDLVSALG